MLNPRRTWTVTTSYIPEIPKNGRQIGYETILVGEKYYTHFRLVNCARPSFLNQLFPENTYQIEPKPWEKISTDLYY